VLERGIQGLFQQGEEKGRLGALLTQLCTLWLVNNASVTPVQSGFPTMRSAKVFDFVIMPKARRVCAGKKSPEEKVNVRRVQG
jgi:hypothetical protein